MAKGTGNRAPRTPAQLEALARGRRALEAKWDARARERLEAYGRAMGLTAEQMAEPPGTAFHPPTPPTPPTSAGAMYGDEVLRNYPALGYFVVAAGILRREGEGNGKGNG